MPASYGIEQGERLSSVLEACWRIPRECVSGPSVLERVQVRELGEQARQQMINESKPRQLILNQSDVRAGASIYATVASAAATTSSYGTSQPSRQRPAGINISSDISKWKTHRRILKCVQVTRWSFPATEFRDDKRPGI